MTHFSSDKNSNRNNLKNPLKANKISDDLLEGYFSKFRDNIVGINQEFETQYGKQKIHYFDWTASGRLYMPIEKVMANIFGHFVGNTHSESSVTGVSMTIAYHEAREIIKKHCNASVTDVILMTGTGTTGAINKLQRILGLKFIDQLRHFESIIKFEIKGIIVPEEYRPVIFVTHMEHHSNHTSWIETDSDVVVIPAGKNGRVEPENLRKLLDKYRNRKLKIGSFTACSNVTGIQTPYYELARTMHQNEGYCFIDFAAAAPYINIDMHPVDAEERLDAIFFSPHKFLGGPATPGVLIFDKNLYPDSLPPDHPGGGTVLWTNPWGGRKYHEDIETREDGGTPGFLQTIKAALCIELKEKIGVDNILKREEYLLDLLMTELRKIPRLHLLDDCGNHRLGIVSFYIDNLHYNLVVKILNDRYGIQVRGGCSCAGTYGHCLFGINEKESKKITDLIDKTDHSTKPGWVRVSLHPTILDDEVYELIAAIRSLIENIGEWKKDYIYDSTSNEFRHRNESISDKEDNIGKWFKGAF